MEESHFESLYPPDARYDEIEKILSITKNGNSTQLISLPGVGRSNILGLLSFNRNCREKHLGENQKWFHFVMMNFSEIKKRPFVDCTKYIFLELVESLEERKMDEETKVAKKYFDESLKSNDELVLFQGLKKTIDFLCLQKELTVVFLFDRFEEYIPMLTPAFFDNLRVLRDRAKYRFSVIFPLNRPLEEIVEPEIISSFYEFIVGNIVYLPLMDKKILDFRISYLQKNSKNKLSEKVIDDIIGLTGGVGKLVRVCVEFGLEGNEITKTNLFNSSRVKSVLNEIWKSLTPFEQNLLLRGVYNESSNLVAVGLIKNNKIAIPLLEDFIKNASVNNQKITFDENTNEVKKGEVALSDSLTSSEYKLLRYFVLNPEKILERDEIIKAVWGDLSSTAGVTEQAIDQLVFRLRKKIETNPNSPTHIQTIKGRGFKFIS